MKTKKLVISAMLIALSAVLSVFQPFQLPFGGGITLASMMPIIIIAFCFGTKWGLLSAFIFSLLQLLFGLKTITAFFLPGESQMLVWQALAICLLDYIVAYTVLGFGGIFKNRIKNPFSAICIGSIVALSLRYLVHTVSGALFFGAWAEWFFTQEGFYAIGAKIMEIGSGPVLSVIYSVFYNGTYMIPEIIITTIVTPIVYKALIAAKLTD
ncbi:MAG: energy-coupled thiamine transporter ThiT [Clostridia bacterium]|nr:energy-coupled thiamine transporter ThiT [Clostridia bacterium]